MGGDRRGVGMGGRRWEGIGGVERGGRDGRRRCTY